MRPQHITAENAGGASAGAIGLRWASMRPQHITAENPGGYTVTPTNKVLLQ